MLAILGAFFFLFGTLVGSFLNVIIYRYHQQNWVGGRSMCFSCGKTLKWYELVPIFSYLFLRGKCKDCKSSISKQYILVEIFTGILFMGVALKGLVGLEAFVPLLVMCLLVVILVYDIHHKIIPDGVVYILITVSFLQLFVDLSTWSIIVPTVSALLAGPVLFLPFFALWYFSEGTWMGLGDGKLVLAMGWFLGLGLGVSAVIYSFWIGAIVALLLLLVQSRKSRAKGDSQLHMKSEIPFAPFLIAGFMLAYYFDLHLVDLILIV